jgi:hypothetical protein
MGTSPAENLHIGDSRTMPPPARAAGCPVFIVPYGYNEGEDVQGIDCDAIVASLAEPRSPYRQRRLSERSHNCLTMLHRNLQMTRKHALGAEAWPWRA